MGLSSGAERTWGTRDAARGPACYRNLLGRSLVGRGGRRAALRLARIVWMYGVQCYYSPRQSASAELNYASPNGGCDQLVML